MPQGQCGQRMENTIVDTIDRAGTSSAVEEVLRVIERFPGLVDPVFYQRPTVFVADCHAAIPVSSASLT